MMLGRVANRAVRAAACACPDFCVWCAALLMSLYRGRMWDACRGLALVTCLSCTA